MSRAKYSEEFKEQVVREVIDKERSIASVAASYGLVAQTVGN
ncbi:transposase [Actinomyces slackii]|uniref:Transposase n=1 Tax=Actinomyces slackii TaxID=52774 RepID=A0A3S4U3R2_9ACTO|nr:transposase [Actinomyces slackii]VEG75769.1 Transposase [Actinomyces slackii]